MHIASESQSTPYQFTERSSTFDFRTAALTRAFFNHSISLLSRVGAFCRLTFEQYAAFISRHRSMKNSFD